MDHSDHDVTVAQTPGIGVHAYCSTCAVDLVWNEFDLPFKTLVEYVTGVRPPMVA